MLGEGPQLDMEGKKGEVGLRNSPAKEEMSEKQPREVALWECV